MNNDFPGVSLCSPPMFMAQGMSLMPVIVLAYVVLSASPVRLDIDLTLIIDLGTQEKLGNTVSVQ